MTLRTRFAPSPTGPLHLGHAYSAILGFDMARAQGGEWVLRIEDIDRQRSKPQWERQIEEDLAWLGLSWPRPALRQSDRLDAYAVALRELWGMGVLYQCECSRADIAAALDAPQEGNGPRLGPDGLVYPGTCREKGPGRAGPSQAAAGRIVAGDAASEEDREAAEHVGAATAANVDWQPTTRALRLRMDRLPDCARLGGAGRRQPLSFVETGCGPGGEHGVVGFTFDEMVHGVGDVVVARRDMGTSYHLSVVLDDAVQGITHVVRGQDLFEATRIHVVLQKLLGLPTPVYHHHPLIRDEAGRRLAKREDAKAVRRFRDEGATPQDIRRMVGL